MDDGIEPEEERPENYWRLSVNDDYKFLYLS